MSRPTAEAQTGAAPSSSSSPPPAAKSQGKKKKIFSESLGLAHMLSLASEVGTVQDQRNRGRAEKNRQTEQFKKAKRVEAAAAKSGKTKSSTSAAPNGTPSSSTGVRSKAVIRAELKAQRREKTKARKEKRKATAATAGSSSETTKNERMEDAELKALSKSVKAGRAAAAAAAAATATDGNGTSVPALPKAAPKILKSRQAGKSTPRTKKSVTFA